MDHADTNHFVPLESDDPRSALTELISYFFLVSLFISTCVCFCFLLHRRDIATCAPSATLKARLERQKLTHPTKDLAQATANKSK
jgi:hypothetical protein